MALASRDRRLDRQDALFGRLWRHRLLCTQRLFRDLLIGNCAHVRLVYLKGEERLIARRIATRHEHFMPRSLLHSQFDALEEPGPAENPVIVSIEPERREIVAHILSLLNFVGETTSFKQSPLTSSALGAKTSP